jgi:hypothetical protein
MELHNLEIDTILQQTCSTCGPAVARMVLGPSAPQEAILFRQILASMGRRDPCFVSSPEAVADVLGSVMRRGFRVERRRTVDEVNKVIVNALFDQRLPVPVLVKGCQHWVVASGFLYSDESSKIEISTFVINDPYNTCLDCDHNGVTAPQCQQGGFSGDSGDGVPASEWRKNWLTGCKCERDKEELICVVPAEAADGPRDVGDLTIVDPGFGRPLGFEDLGDRVDRLVNLYGLWLLRAFSNSLEGASVGNARKVLSDQGTYYLTEVGRTEGVTALFLFDQSTGALISARALKAPVTRVLPESIEQLRGILRAWRDEHHIEESLEEALTNDTPLRWKFSNEFKSQYFPFLEIGDNNRRIVIGINGVVYGRELREARA